MLSERSFPLASASAGVYQERVTSVFVLDDFVSENSSAFDGDLT